MKAAPFAGRSPQVRRAARAGDFFRRAAEEAAYGDGAVDGGNPADVRAVFCKKSFFIRIKGERNAFEKSDIDIAVSGVCDFDGFSEAIDEIETLYGIDLLNLDACKNQSLLEDIREYGKKIYEAV